MDIRIKKLINIWINLKFKVEEFEILYPEDEQTYTLINSLIPDFFANINDLYWESFLMTIARLLDSPNVGSKTNLTLFTLSEILKEDEKNEWKNIENKIEALKERNKDIITYRKKYLAHFDIDYSIGKKVFDTSTHIVNVRYFLNEMHTIINETLNALGLEKENGFMMYPAQYKGSRELLNILRNEQNNKERIKLN